MIGLTGTLAGFDAVNRLLDGLEDKAIGAVERGVARGVLGGQSIVRGNARGRPGPRAPTGDFNRSITSDWERKGQTVFGQIGTNADQGRRLEFGFRIADVLGRVYDQPPYPFLAPSVVPVEKMVGEQIAAEIEKEFG